MNTELAPGELTLSGGYTLNGGFVPDRQAVADAIKAVVVATNMLSMARSDRDILRDAIGLRFKQFRAALHAFLPGSNYLESIPSKPYPASSAGEWQQATDRLANLWGRIDANSPPVAGFVPPLLLAGGYGRAQFVADADELVSSYEEVSRRTMELQLARALRDETFEGPRARMVQYRMAVLGTFAEGHELIATLPSVTQ